MASTKKKGAAKTKKVPIRRHTLRRRSQLRRVCVERYTVLYGETPAHLSGMVDGLKADAEARTDWKEHRGVDVYLQGGIMYAEGLFYQAALVCEWEFVRKEKAARAVKE